MLNGAYAAHRESLRVSERFRHVLLVIFAADGVFIPTQNGSKIPGALSGRQNKGYAARTDTAADLLKLFMTAAHA